MADNPLAPYDGVLHSMSQDACAYYYNETSSLVPSFKKAAIIEVSTLVQHESKIGSIFENVSPAIDEIQNNSTSANDGGNAIEEKEEAQQKSQMGRYDTITLRQIGHIFRNDSCDFGDNDDVPEAKTRNEYDMDCVYVERVEVVGYSNGYPLDFYIKSNFLDSAEKRRHGDDSLGFKNIPRIVGKLGYLFDASQKDESWFRDKGFPHCIYSSYGTTSPGFVVSYAGTSVEQITTGIVETSESDTIEGERCYYVDSSHALCCVLASACMDQHKRIVAMHVLPEGQKQSDRLVFGLEKLEENAVLTDEERKKKVGYFFPASIIENVLTTYYNNVHPDFSREKERRLDDLLSLDVIYYKNGVKPEDLYQKIKSTSHRDVPSVCEEECSRYLNDTRKLTVQLKFTLLAFQKGHKDDKKVMCCDFDVKETLRLAVEKAKSVDSV